MGYSVEDGNFLEDQVSLWLENDLPTYYWFNQVSTEAINRNYLNFTENCTKVIYDSQVEEEGFLKIGWPNPELLNDLALARLLPVRQSLGHFLSGYPPEVLTESLKKVKVGWGPGNEAEAKELLNWCKQCLLGCGGRAKEVNFSTHEIEKENPQKCLEMEWVYEGPKYFKWWYCEGSKRGEIKAKLRTRGIIYPLRLKPLAQEEALAGACFY